MHNELRLTNYSVYNLSNEGTRKKLSEKHNLLAIKFVVHLDTKKHSSNTKSKSRFTANMLKRTHYRGVEQAARGPQPGPPSHSVRPLPTLWFLPIMQCTVYIKKLNCSCGPARCLKLAHRQKMLHSIFVLHYTIGPPIPYSAFSIIFHVSYLSH